VNPEDRDILAQSLDKKGELRNIELVLKRKDGDHVIVLENARAVRDEQNRVLYYEGTLIDITKRKKAEEALKGSEKKFRSIVENSHAGIFIVDEDYKFIYINNELCRILKYSHEEIVDHDFREFLDGESKQLVADRYIKRQRGEKAPSRYEFNIVQKNGEKRRVEISSTVIKDSAGKVRTVAQILDITERKKSEELLKKQREELSAFAHTVSHDLKNYINIIRNYAQFSLLKKENAEKNAQEIVDMTKKMENFVNRQLQLADAGKAIGEPEKVDLNKLIGEVGKMYSTEIQTKGLPTIKGDPQRLKEAFHNLIDNAVKHGEADRIEISSEKKENIYVIYVKDNGKGIPKEDIDKIFDMGYSKTGTGVGLTIVKKIVEAHEGNISVRSKEGKGATFEIIFPIKA
jgi:PAS domain S-box-containing protein